MEGVRRAFIVKDSRPSSYYTVISLFCHNDDRIGDFEIRWDNLSRLPCQICIFSDSIRVLEHFGDVLAYLKRHPNEDPESFRSSLSDMGIEDSTNAASLSYS